MKRTDEIFLLQRRCEVLRCWEEGIFYPFQIFRSIWQHRRQIDMIHIQHEYAQFGRSLSVLLFPLLVGLLRFLHKPIVITLHGVIGKNEVTNSFSGQHFIKGLRPCIRYGFSFVNKCIGHLANCLIVHEEHLKKILIEDYNVARKKIEVIPHGVEIRKDIVGKEAASQALGVEGRRMLLFFGYLAGYKGLDILIKAFQFLQKDQYVLFIAGGEPHHLADNPLYVKYLAHMKQTAQRISKHIIFTGFVPEEKIAVYFSAADLVIFPYPEMHAFSGPFCFVLSYKCPFLVSKAFANFCGSPPELSFEYNAKSLANKITEFFKSEDFGVRAVEWIEKFKYPRLWSNVARHTMEVYAKLHSNTVRKYEWQREQVG